VTGGGVFPFGPLGITPTDLLSTTNYYGLFFADTFDVTNRLTLTVGGRYNFADINLNDQAEAFKAGAFPGEDSSLSGDHIYVRFNPSIGVTYKLSDTLSLYGGYSEANRAPTPAELACSNPDQPCLLENFLVSDPNLKQVVSHTWEGGLRGKFIEPRFSGNVDWSFGFFHTLNVNDIINVLDLDQPTRGFFQNAGNTLRQGIEAKVTYRLPDVSLYANYALVDATFQNNLTLPSPNNPLNVNGSDSFSINVQPGDRLPSIPRHRFKAGFDYSLTENWRAGADFIYASSQVFVGDESNQNVQLPGYGVVNLHTSYDINKNIQIYGLVQNLFNNKYALYGTYFDAQEVNLTDPRTETPAQPFSVYGGVKIKF
jgi:iron complex outermembrane receptor protein